MLSELTRAIADGFATLAASLPKTIVLVGEPLATTWIEQNGAWLTILAAFISAGAAAITAVWAFRSGRVATELHKIEKAREAREGAELRLFRDPQNKNPTFIGTVFNAGRSATRIESAFVSTDGVKESAKVHVTADMANRPHGLPYLGRILSPGDVMSLGFEGTEGIIFGVTSQKKLYLVLNAIHSSAPIVIEFENRLHSDTESTD